MLVSAFTDRMKWPFEKAGEGGGSEDWRTQESQVVEKNDDEDDMREREREREREKGWRERERNGDITHSRTHARTHTHIHTHTHPVGEREQWRERRQGCRSATKGQKTCRRTFGTNRTSFFGYHIIFIFTVPSSVVLRWPRFVDKTLKSN